MKILSLSATGAALLLFGGLACHAQNPQAPPAALVPGPATSPIPDGPPLETRAFEVWPDFLSKGSSQPDPLEPNSPSSRSTVKIVLEQLGVEFATAGAKASWGPGRNEITVTNTREQLDNIEAVLTPMGSGPPRQGQVHLEVFSLPPLVARKALIAHQKETELYAWLDIELAKPGSPVKLERHSITIVRGGQRSKTEGINEIPQATKFSPGRISLSINPPPSPAGAATSSGNPNSPSWPETGPTPQAFITRNAGWTFEVEAIFLDDGKSVDLNMAPETTRRLGTAKFGRSQDIYQPLFETQKCAGQASGIIGQPMLVSTFSPAVNTGVPGGNKVDRTWLLFVTVTDPE